MGLNSPTESEFHFSYCIFLRYPSEILNKITYNLGEFKWLQVRIQHQCMTKDHILAMNSNDYKSEYSINACQKITYRLNEFE